MRNRQTNRFGSLRGYRPRVNRWYLLFIGIAIWAAVIITVLQIVDRLRGDDPPYRAASVTRIAQPPGPCYAISPDGSAVVAGLSLVNFETGDPLLEGIYSSPLTYFSPDGRLIAMIGSQGVIAESTPPGVYVAATGERYLDLPAGPFSPDGALLIAPGDGLYDVATGERLLELPADANAHTFSEDGALLAVENLGLYRLNPPEPPEQLFPLGAGEPQFAAQNTRLLVDGTGIYSIPDGELLLDAESTVRAHYLGNFAHVQGAGIYRLDPLELRIPTEASYTQYRLSRDERYAVIDGDGVYALATGERLFGIEGGSAVFFGDNGDWLVAGGDAVYAVPSGERAIPLAEGVGAFSVALNDAETLLAIGGDGLYALDTRERRFEIGEARRFIGFERDDQWLVVGGDAVYVTASGQRLHEAPAVWTRDPAGETLVIAGTGVFNLDRGDLRFALGDVRGGVRVNALKAFGIWWSDDGRLMWVPGDSVYNFETGQRLMDVARAFDVILHPQGRGFVVIGQEQGCALYHYDAE